MPVYVCIRGERSIKSTPCKSVSGFHTASKGLPSNPPWKLWIVANDRSFGAIRTTSPYIMCRVSIAQGYRPDIQWYAYHTSETAAILGPGNRDSGWNHSRYTERAATYSVTCVLECHHGQPHAKCIRNLGFHVDGDGLVGTGWPRGRVPTATATTPAMRVHDKALTTPYSKGRSLMLAGCWARFGALVGGLLGDTGVARAPAGTKSRSSKAVSATSRRPSTIANMSPFCRGHSMGPPLRRLRSSKTATSEIDSDFCSMQPKDGFLQSFHMLWAALESPLLAHWIPVMGHAIRFAIDKRVFFQWAE